MGFSTSGATMILFLGVLVSAGVLVPATERAFEDVSESIDDRDERMLERRNTRLLVSNATYNGSTDTLNVSANNTGSTTLSVNATDVLVDGVLQDGYRTVVDGRADRSLWLPGETLTVTVSNVSSVPDRVKVVSGSGVAAVSTNVTVIT